MDNDGTLLARLASLSVDELERELDFHDYRYWILGKPVIRDETYDLLCKRLKELAPQSPLALRVGGPTSGLPGDKVTHPVPMLSLDKCYDRSEFLAWLDMLAGVLGLPSQQLLDSPVVVTPKIDGMAASLVFDQTGRLQRAATRGDGRQGEDFSVNARQVPDIPVRLPEGPLEVRGEIHMKNSVFRQKYQAQFANPRNLSAGLIKQKEGSPDSFKDLAFFAYEVLGRAFSSEAGKLRFLEEQGFSIPPHLVMPAARVPEYFEGLAAIRQAWDFDADGIVVRLDRSEWVEQAGATSHHPRGAVAFKFQGDTGTSRLLEVEWSVSRSARITPVAIVEPVVLSGARVSRASLHNIEVFRNHGLKLGDTVQVTRRGGVIPNLEASLGGGEVEVRIPTHCPVCNRESLLLAPALFLGGVRVPRGADLGDLRDLAQERERLAAGEDRSDLLWLTARLCRKSAGAAQAGVSNTPDLKYKELLSWRKGDGGREQEVRRLLSALPYVEAAQPVMGALLCHCPGSPASAATLSLLLEALPELRLRVWLLPVLEPHLGQGGRADETFAELCEDPAGVWDRLLAIDLQNPPPGCSFGQGRLEELGHPALSDLALGLSDGVLCCGRPSDCAAVVRGSLLHFARVMGMDGFGPRVVELLHETGLLSAPVDYYRLSAQDVSALPKLGELSAEKLLAQVERARRVPLQVFLSALGIEDMADSVSELVAGRWPTLEQVRALATRDLEILEGMNFNTAFKVVSGLRRLRPVLDALLAHVSIIAPESSKGSMPPGPLAGLSFVFTGALSAMPRKEAQEKVAALGAKTPSSVTKDLTHLVVGQEEGSRASSKLKSAQKLIDSGAGLKIIGEQEFLELLAAAEAPTVKGSAAPQST